MTTEATAPEADAGELAQALLATTSRLIQVLQREIDLLRDMEPREMQAVQEEKIVLAAAFEARMKALRDLPPEAGELDPKLREALREAAAQFQDVLAVNHRMLGAAKQATDSLLSAMVEAVRKQQPSGPGYSAAGAPSKGRPGTLGTPVALDQRL